MSTENTNIEENYILHKNKNNPDTVDLDWAAKENYLF
jgi:hypothetical protein